MIHTLPFPLPSLQSLTLPNLAQLEDCLNIPIDSQVDLKTETSTLAMIAAQLQQLQSEPFQQRQQQQENEQLLKDTQDTSKSLLVSKNLKSIKKRSLPFENEKIISNNKRKIKKLTANRKNVNQLSNSTSENQIFLLQ